jgi:Animal haem peroxidase
MPRLRHGATISLDAFQAATESVAARSADVPLAFAAAVPTDVQDFDFLFPALQDDPANLLPTSRATRDNLVKLGRVMRDTGGGPGADSEIPAAYTYFGQFVDHDVTLETTSATADQLVHPDLVPQSLDHIRTTIRNLRTATLDLDSVYGLPAPRNGGRMGVGRVSPLNGTTKPLLRPRGKDDRNDVPREPRNTDLTHDRAALIGDPRNDENTIIAQLQVAFLRAHNTLVGQGRPFREARKLLRQHYQHVVISDFLPRICDPTIVRNIVRRGNRVYDALAEPFFLPLEYAVAAYRFGHSMIRADYDFNLNFNTSGEPGTFPATLGLLFTFTALSGGFDPVPGTGTDTLPENWIIEWERFVDVGKPFNKARRLDPKLVEPLFELRDITGAPEAGDKARLAVRNLLRGYLLRLPTGQAVARALQAKWDNPVLTPAQVAQGAASQEQVQVLTEAGFLDRTPLWYYILAEANVLGQGQHLGPVGSILVAEVLVGLVRRSEDSILRTRNWKPSLPSARPNKFELADLLRLGGVLPERGRRKAAAVEAEG